MVVLKCVHGAQSRGASDRVPRVPPPQRTAVFLRDLRFVFGVEAGAPTLYVQIGSVILLGIGIIAGASRTRPYRNPPDVTVVRDLNLRVSSGEVVAVLGRAAGPTRGRGRAERGISSSFHSL